MLGRRVEEGVGGRIGAQAEVADDPRDRGEEDEGGEIEALGQLVQVPGGVDLGSEDGVDLLRCDLLDQVATPDPGGVDYGAQAVLRGDRVDQRRELLALRGVAWLDPHLSTQLSQLRRELLCAVSPPAAATGEQ